jgi:hypothetical protein
MFSMDDLRGPSGTASYDREASIGIGDGWMIVFFSDPESGWKWLLAEYDGSSTRLDMVRERSFATIREAVEDASSYEALSVRMHELGIPIPAAPAPSC